MARIHFLKQLPGNVAGDASTPKHLHPLTAAAAVSVITVSLLGVGIMTGVVPDLRRNADVVVPVAGAVTPKSAVPAAILVHANPVPRPAASAVSIAGSQPAVVATSNAPGVPAELTTTTTTTTATAATAFRTVADRAPVPPALALAPGEVLIAPDALSLHATPLLPVAKATVATPKPALQGKAIVVTSRPVRNMPTATVAPMRSTLSGGLTDGATYSGRDERVPDRERIVREEGGWLETRRPVFEAPVPVRPSPRITPVIRPPIPLDTPLPQSVSIGEGIDRTLSALADVFGGQRPVAPPVQDFPLDQSRYPMQDRRRDQPYVNGAYQR